MRITYHNGRAGSDGVYSAKHNDRNFDLENAEHIDQDRTYLNRYWKCDKTADSFEECEKKFYEATFTHSLEARNERYRAQGHAERCRTMEQYRMNEKSCPEETIMQVGKSGDEIDSDRLWKVMMEQIKWEHKQYPNVVYLDIALHRDEGGQDHIHARKVWIGHDNDGFLTVGQKKALDEMGVSIPDPEKKISKFNNQKMTYSESCREHLIEMVREFYPEVEPLLELEPKEASKTGLSLLEYKRQQELEKLQELQTQMEQLKAQLETQRLQIDELSSEKAEYDKKIKQAQQRLQKVEKELQTADMDKEKLASVRQELKMARKELKTTLDMTQKAATKKPIFGGEYVQYHKQSLETIEAIGREAEEHMAEAYKDLQQIAKREQAVAKKEAEVEPMHAEAKKELARAKELKQGREDFITEKAEKLASEKLEQAFKSQDDKYTKRLEKFVSGYSVDDKSLLDTFKEQEQALKLKIRQNMNLGL